MFAHLSWMFIHLQIILQVKYIAYQDHVRNARVPEKIVLKIRSFAITERYRNIDILYEDNHLLVVYKPANMLSQRDHTGDRDLQSLLKKWLKDKYQKPGDVFLGLVQRLDRPTRGLMVLARTSKAASRLSEQIRKRTFVKEYLAVVVGKNIKSREMTHELEKDPSRKMAVVVTSGRNDLAENDGKQKPRGSATSKQAVLNITRLETQGEHSLVKIDLKTGRFHQIRIQLAAEGIPISGDHKYGSSGRQTRQLALMCHKIAFEHPTRRERMQFTAGPPKEFPWDQFQGP